MKLRSLRSGILPVWFAVTAGAMGSQTLQAVPAAQVRALVPKLQRDLLPAGSSGVEFARTQVMRTTGAAVVTLVPVRFRVERPDGLQTPGMPRPTKYACGVLVVRGDASQRFVATMGMPGSDREAEECTELRAIGAAEPNQPGGGLVTIYRVSVLHAPPPEEFNEAVLLEWNGDGTLQVDEERTKTVSERLKIPPTIPAVRRFLAATKRNDQ